MLLRKRELNGAWIPPETFLINRFIENAARAVSLRGHTSSISALQFALQSNYCQGCAPLVSADDDGQLRVWDVSQPQARCTVKIDAHTKSIGGLAMSPTQPLMLTGSDDKTIRLWDLSVMSRSGPKSQASHRAGLVKQFDGHSSYVTSVNFDSSGRVMASSSLDCTIRIWHKEVSEAVFVFHSQHAVRRVSFVPGELHLLLSAGDGGALLWDIRKHTTFLERAAQRQAGGSGCSSAAPSDDESGASASGGVWSGGSPAFRRASRRAPNMPPPRRRPVRPPRPVSNPIDSASEAETSASDSDFSSSDDYSGFWNTGSWSGSGRSYLADTEKEEFDVPLLKFDDANTNAAEVFNKTTKRYERRFTGHDRTAKVFGCLPSPHGQHVLTSATDGTHKLFDLHTQRGVASFEMPAVDGAMLQPCFSPDGRLLMSGTTDGRIALWRAARPSLDEDFGQAQAFPAHPRAIMATCFNSDGTAIASGDTLGLVKVFSPAEPQ